MAGSRGRKCFVVGVTGPSALDGFDVDQIRALVILALKQIKEAADACFPQMRKTSRGPRLTLISCLSAGTDQLAAENLGQQGYGLHVVLPGPRGTYEDCIKVKRPDKTIDEERSEIARKTYRSLLDAAGRRVTELAYKLPKDDEAADAQQQRNEAYEAASRYMVRRSDLLIAVADVTGRASLDATGDAIRMAMRAGKPVLWIDPRRPMFLRWLSHLSEPEFLDLLSLPSQMRLVPPLKEGPNSKMKYAPQPEPESGEFVKLVIEGKVHRILAAKQEAKDHRRVPAKRWFFQRWPAKIWDWMIDQPLPRELEEHYLPEHHGTKTQLDAWQHDIWSGIKLLGKFWWTWLKLRREWLASLFSRKKPKNQPGSPDTRTPYEKFVDTFAEHVVAERKQASAASAFYAGAHRSSFWSICALGVIAVLVASLGPIFESSGGHSATSTTQPTGLHIHPFPLFEMGVLGVMMLIYIANRTWRWQEKSINFRLLTERLRHGGMLMLLGNDPIDSTTLPAQYSDLHPHKTWVGYAFERTVNRLQQKLDSAIPQTGKTSLKELLKDPVYVNVCRAHVQANWLDQQADYHLEAANKYEALALILEAIGFSMLMVTFLMCIVHALLGHDAFSIFGSVLPAFGGAAGALGAQAEVGRLRDRARAMHRSLYRRRWLFDLLKGREVEVLQQFMRSTAQELLNEVTEWRVVFKFRPIKSPG